MGLKARLSSYCTKRANNGVNLVTSRNINTRLARPIVRTGWLLIMVCISFSRKIWFRNSKTSLFIGWLCFTSHRLRGHLQMPPPPPPRTSISVNIPGIEPRVVAWHSIELPLRHASSLVCLSLQSYRICFEKF